MPEDQRVMYSAIASIRDNEVTRRWTRTQFFFAVHSGALSIVSSQLEITSFLFGASSFGGMFLAMLWLNATDLGNRWVRFWSECLAALEQVQVQPVKVFSSTSLDQMMLGVTFYHITVLLATTFLIVWGAMFVYSLTTFLSTLQ